MSCKFKSESESDTDDDQQSYISNNSRATIYPSTTAKSGYKTSYNEDNDVESLMSKNTSKLNSIKLKDCDEDSHVKGDFDQTSKCFNPIPDVLGSETNLSSICSLSSCKANPNLSYESLKEILAQHIQNRKSDIQNACRNYDPKSKGKMTRTELIGILNMFFMPLTREQITSLLQNLAEDDHGKINYANFFSNLCGGNFEMSQKTQFSIREHATLEDLEVSLRRELLPNLQFVIRSFQMFDKNNDGYVKKTEFKKVLESFSFAVPQQSFSKLWSRYGDPERGLLNYEDFLILLGINTQRIESQLPQIYQHKHLFWEKPCSKIYPNDPNYSKDRTKALTGKKDDPSIQGLSMEEIQRFFLSKIRECRQLLEIMLPIFEIDMKEIITLKDLYSVLNTFIMPMSDGLFKELILCLKLNISPISKSINYQAFLDQFCQQIDNRNEPTREDLGLSAKNLAIKYSKLNGNKLMKKMKYHINQNRKTFDHALMACDPDKCGLISPKQLKQVINSFCFPLSESQFKELYQKLEMQGSRVYYGRFLQMFEKKPGEDAEQWIKMVHKILSQPRPEENELSVLDLKAFLKDTIKSKLDKISKDFLLVDPCKTGYCYKDDAKAIVDKYMMRTTDEQFEKLWSIMPKNAHGRLIYEDLIENFQQDDSLDSGSRCSSPTGKYSVAEEENLENTSGEDLEPMKCNNKDRNEAFKQYPYLKTVYNKVNKKLTKKIGIIRQNFSQVDKKRSGMIPYRLMADILKDHGIKLINEDQFYLEEYFDKKDTGEISYRKFISVFAN